MHVQREAVFDVAPRFHQRSIKEIKGGSIWPEARGTGWSLVYIYIYPRGKNRAGLDSLDQSFRQLKDGSTRDVYVHNCRLWNFFSLPVFPFPQLRAYQPRARSNFYRMLEDLLTSPPQYFSFAVHRRGGKLTSQGNKSDRPRGRSDGIKTREKLAFLFRGGEATIGA